MIFSERELLFQQGHFDAQIAESERAARERFREHEHAAFLKSKGHSTRLRDHRAKRDAQPAKAAQSVASPKPVAKAAAPVAPPPLSAAARAAMEAETRRHAAIDLARRQAAAREAELKRQADIRDSWAKAHARAADPFGRNEPDDPKANHGWAGIHAEIRARRGN